MNLYSPAAWLMLDDDDVPMTRIPRLGRTTEPRLKALLLERVGAGCRERGVPAAASHLKRRGANALMGS